MDRAQLKQVLDVLASNSATLRQIEVLMSQGPKRSLTVTSGQSVIHVDSLDSDFVWIPEDPRTATASLVAIGQYEPIETSLLCALARFSTVVLDYYAVLLGKCVRPDGRVISFEPLPAAHHQLVTNVELNNLQRTVTCLPVALSNANGSAVLHVPAVSGTSATSLRILHPDESNLEVTIETKTLDSVVGDLHLDHIDLVKIDVEGAELLVMQGGWSTIQRTKPAIFAELLRKWSAGFGYHPNDLVTKLAELGYQCFAVGDQVRPIDEIDDDTIETNFLFLTDSTSHREMVGSLHELKLLI